MEINQKILKQLMEELPLSDETKVFDMPDFDLYMEQLTSLMDSWFAGFKRDDEEKVLTKTMINNYTKAGLLMPPKNKKYNKDHMILLILIYYLKNILSINDIKTLFTPILNNISSREDDVISLEEIYSSFLELKQVEFDCFADDLIQKSDLIKSKTENIENHNKEIARLFLIVIMLVAQANAQKRLAEKIIDRYFKETEPGE